MRRVGNRVDSTGILRAITDVVKISRMLHLNWHGGPCARISARCFPEKTEEDHESGFGCADRMPGCK